MENYYWTRNFHNNLNGITFQYYNSETVFEKTFKETYEIPKIPIAIDDSDMRLQSQAMRQYHKEQFQNVVETLNIPQEETLNMESYFILGISYIETKQFDNAEHVFKKVVSKKEGNLFLESSQWYLALLYFRNENFNAAKELLNSLSDSYDYKDKVEILLKEIPNN